jgi:hypothetical protein
MKRLVQLADRIAGHPAETLPAKINHPAKLKSLYRLMDCRSVTHASVLAPARERTLQRMRDVPGTVLLIHDTTELDYTGLTSLMELGQIGNGSHRRYVTHRTLAVLPETREVIGLVYQKLAKRPHVKKDETREEMRARPDRESRLWESCLKSPSIELWALVVSAIITLALGEWWHWVGSAKMFEIAPIS